MPQRAKRPCSHPGCPELTTEQYCPAHKKQTVAHYNRHVRDPKTAKRYDGRWRKIRAAYINKHPLCEICQANGRLIPATEVHHKKELAEGGTHAEHNLQSLCLSCHSAIHMKRRYDTNK